MRALRMLNSLQKASSCPHRQISTGEEFQRPTETKLPGVRFRNEGNRQNNGKRARSAGKR